MQSNQEVGESPSGVGRNEPTIRVPVRCPKCGNERLAELSVAELAIAIIEKRAFHLYSACHGESWAASQAEAQKIREYLARERPWIGDAQIESHR
jgi:hypothetical protein